MRPPRGDAILIDIGIGKQWYVRSYVVGPYRLYQLHNWWGAPRREWVIEEVVTGFRYFGTHKTLDGAAEAARRWLDRRAP